MRKLYFSIPFCYPHIIRQELKACKSILDIGCGVSPITVKTDLKPEYTVGVDIVPKYSKIAHALHEVIVGDIKYIKFCEDSFDGAVANDIIEHLHKKMP